MVSPYKNTLLLIRRNQIMIYATTLVNPPQKATEAKTEIHMFYVLLLCV